MSGAAVPTELSARLLAHGERGVRRISIDVQTEQVTFSLRDGRVRAQCTCGAETCEHQSAALALFREPVVSGSSSDANPMPVSLSLSVPREVRVRSSLRPPAHVAASALGLADALDELCLATARAGVSASESASIRAALEQLSHAASDPPSLSLARFIGRFHGALAMGEVGKLARLLSGAQAFAAELRSGDTSREAQARARAWLGVGDADSAASLTEVVLLEVGREWLAGLTRSAIERRYLVDASSGELYCEERRRGEHDISVGPCPRVVQVAFAELTTATVPPRARLLQYTVSPEPSAAHWQRLSELGESRLSVLATQFATATRRCPGLAEPCVLFAAAELTAGVLGALRDASGARLELRDDADGMLLDALRALVGSDEIVWVLGRLRGLARGLSLRPVSVLVKGKGGLRLRRVT